VETAAITAVITIVMSVSTVVSIPIPYRINIGVRNVVIRLVYAFAVSVLDDDDVLEV
jgi:hypothetical protein